MVAFGQTFRPFRRTCIRPLSALPVDHPTHAAPCVTVRNDAATCRLHSQHLSLARPSGFGWIEHGNAP